MELFYFWAKPKKKKKNEKQNKNTEFDLYGQDVKFLSYFFKVQHKADGQHIKQTILCTYM